jgi:hypothetical protein
MTRKLPPIHRNTPRALRLEYRKLNHNMRELARVRNVNMYHVYKLIKQGIEPTNPEIRLRLSLPARPHNQLSIYLAWWRSLPLSTRRRVSQNEFEKEIEHAR